MATIVAFHAHPDDEVLATGGTLARLAAEGHRVVIVVATDGVMGPATADGAQTRLDELRASASVLGAPGSCTWGARLARVMLALPAPVFGLFFGREWFVEPGAATTTIRSDILQPAPLGSARATGL